jgi:hypothetical protein
MARINYTKNTIYEDLDSNILPFAKNEQKKCCFMWEYCVLTSNVKKRSNNCFIVKLKTESPKEIYY